MSRLRGVGDESSIVFDGLRVPVDGDWSLNRELTEAEVAAMDAAHRAEEREMAARIIACRVDVSITEIVDDPAWLALADVRLEYLSGPGVMSWRGVRLRRWRPDEPEGQALAAPPVCIDFQKLVETAELQRALTPSILASWKTHQREKGRTRLRDVAQQATGTITRDLPKRDDAKAGASFTGAWATARTEEEKAEILAWWWMEITQVDVRIADVADDPSHVALVEVDLRKEPPSTVMQLRGIRLRRWREDEPAGQAVGAPSVCIEFGDRVKTEQLRQALTPEILASWDAHEKKRPRARLRVVPDQQKE
jgi:hypothetical protein